MQKTHGEERAHTHTTPAIKNKIKYLERKTCHELEKQPPRTIEGRDNIPAKKKQRKKSWTQRDRPTTCKKPRCKKKKKRTQEQAVDGGYEEGVEVTSKAFGNGRNGPKRWRIAYNKGREVDMANKLRNTCRMEKKHLPKREGGKNDETVRASKLRPGTKENDKKQKRGGIKRRFNHLC